MDDLALSLEEARVHVLDRNKYSGAANMYDAVIHKLWDIFSHDGAKSITVDLAWYIQ